MELKLSVVYCCSSWLVVIVLTVLCNPVAFSEARKRSARFRATDNAAQNNLNPLVYAQVFWRHGDRAPNAFAKKDPFANSFPQGAGQLTARGWEEQYALGQFLHARYGDYLKLDTNGLSYADVYVRSTDVERAIASAQANIAAFFRPPVKKTKSNNGTTSWETSDTDLGKVWQPVPIHTVPEKDDWVMHQADCAQLDAQKKKFEDSEQVQELKKTSFVQALFRGLSHITGEPVEYWTISKTFKSLADTLYCEYVHGLILPNVPREFYTAVEDLRDRTWAMPYYEKEMAQLRGGCILDTIAQNMRNKFDSLATKPAEFTGGKKPKPDNPYISRKIVLFSGHDTSLLGLISAAGLLEKVGSKPPYAASMYFELYADGMVEISYKNDTTSLNTIRTGQPVSLLKKSLTELENQWKDMRVNAVDYENKCQVSKAEERALMLDDDVDYGED